MKGKSILIVGASGGIGGAVAMTMVELGAVVYNGSRTECGYEGVRNLFLDVERQETVGAAIRQVIEESGRLDYFVYSAGQSIAAPLEHTTDEDMRRLFEVNFFGFVGCLRQVLPIMRGKGHGRIVAVSSLAGTFPVPFDPIYSASKAALDILVREQAIELKPHGLHITSLQPGGTVTPFSFKRKIYSESESGVYSAGMRRAAQALINIEQSGDSPMVVAKEIVRILRAKNPPVTATVGLKNKARKAIAAILPESLAQQRTAAVYKQD